MSQMAYLRGLRIKFGINLVFIASFLKSVPFGERIFLCQLQGDKIGDLCFSTFQNVGIDVGSYAYVAMTEMFGYYFNVNTAVEKHCSVTMSKLMKCKRFKFSPSCKAF